MAPRGPGRAPVWQRPGTFPWPFRALEGARRALNLGTLRTFPGPSWTLGETLSGVWDSPGTFGGRRRVLQSPGPRQEPPVCESSGIFPGRSTVLQEPGRFLERVWYSQGTLLGHREVLQAL
jgi:hypothetical protein